MVAYVTGFANYQACSMVNKEVITDLGPRVNINARLRMDTFGNDPGKKRYSQLKQSMRNAIEADGEEPGICSHDFESGFRCRK